MTHNKSKKDEGKAVIPVPDDAPKTFFQHEHLGMPKSNWPYHTADGKVAMVVCRYINSKGEKSDLPWTYRAYGDGRHDWACKSIPAPRMLYNLHYFSKHPEKPVLVCEGEKAASAASMLFPNYICTTSPNGACNGKSCDWKPCKDHDVVIFPDNDEPGQKHAQQVSQLCLKVGAKSVRIVKIPPDTFPEKWDLADSLPDGWAIDGLQKLIDESEVVTNPLENLVERAIKRSGEPFLPDVLMALNELKYSDHSAFETLRNELRFKAKVRVTELDRAMKGNTQNFDSDDDLSQVDILLMLGKRADLFHNPDSVGFADIEVDGHTETWPIRSKGFRRWLLRQYYDETGGGAPNSESLNTAINSIDAQAYYDGEEHPVFIRVAYHDNKTYIDLCNPEWEVIEIDGKGWRIVSESPVKFRRASGMLSLPNPCPKGSLDRLKSILNVRSEGDFILAVSWLLTALRGAGPYPVLVLTGEHGTAKSTFSKFMRALVDPNGSPLRTLRDERDMFIAATNGHVLAFDNISGMTAATSDTLCRISTGGALATRQLFTDQDEILLNVVRPIILNGIDDVITRPDLGDRALIITLEPISEESRRLESELFSEFDEATPAILGALFDAMVQGYKNLPDTKLDKLPRMADFAVWSSACSEFLWGEQDAFMRAFDTNRAHAIDEILDADPVVSALRELMECKPQWRGTTQDLLRELGDIAGFGLRAPKQWPSSPRGLSGQLRRAAPFLRKIGIEMTFDEKSKDRNRSRIITIAKIAMY